MTRKLGYAAPLVCVLALVAALGYGFSRGQAKTHFTIPAPEYWPTNGWREATPEDQGIDSGKLADIFDYVAKSHVGIHQILVIRNGYVVLDASFYPYDGQYPHDLASCTKSITATLVGAAIQAGKIKSVDERILSYFPEIHPANLDDRKKEITIKDLLTMRGGTQCEYKGGEPTLREMRASANWQQFMLDKPMAAKPGTEFVYCSGGMHLLSALVGRATGSSPADFARRTLFEPLGIKEFVWPADPQGVNFGWGDLHLTPRDMAKIGFLYLHDGVWDGRRILPADFVATAREPLTKTPVEGRYGYGWWVATGDKAGDFEAVGRGGQRITVVPRANAVVVFTGGGDFDPEEIGKLLGKALVSDHPIPQDPAASARLHRAIKQAAEPVSPVLPQGPQAPPPIAHEISGKRYKLAANPIGLQAVTVRLLPDEESTITLSFADGRNETHPVGSGVAKLSPGGQYGLPVAIRGAWESATTYTLDYDTVGNINRYTLRLTFENQHLQLQAQEQGSRSSIQIDGSQQDTN